MDKEKYRIMIVDDEIDVVEGLLASLESLTDFNFEAFDDPYRALQDFLKNPCHLILTDVSMPHIDGFELMKRMKDKRPSCDFILFTAHKSVEIVTRARRLGAAYIFYKPVNLEELVAAINTMHGRYLYWLERLSEVS